MTARTIDVSGQRFGRLVAIEKSLRRGGQLLWLCKCDCGEEHMAPVFALRTGRVKSCGCLNQEMRLARNTVHGFARRGKKIPEYFVWRAMISRCERPADSHYIDYGARGIRVCQRWRDSFEAFLSDMGPRPPGRSKRRARYTIERNDNDGNYEPGNCRWATHSDQMRNRRSPETIRAAREVLRG